MAVRTPRYRLRRAGQRANDWPVSPPTLITLMLAMFLATTVYLRAPDQVEQAVADVAAATRPAALLDAAPAALPGGASDAPGADTRLNSGASDTIRRRFTLCHSGGGVNCVVDGDTFWLDGQKIRIADIDTPETHPPRCAAEARLGAAATRRLAQWLNDGAFSLDSIDRDTDRYGRQLRIVTRGGTSVQAALVGEGLARAFSGGWRDGWCDV